MKKPAFCLRITEGASRRRGASFVWGHWCVGLGERGVRSAGESLVSAGESLVQAAPANSNACKGASACGRLESQVAGYIL